MSGPPCDPCGLYGDDVTFTATLMLERDRKGGALDASVRHINEVLAQAGLGSHSEPRSLREPLDFRCKLRRFPSSWFAYLQRFQAHCLLHPGGIPIPASMLDDPDSVMEDGLVEEVLETGMKPHLMCHSSEGYFVPVDMETPLFDPEGELPGGWLGSSVALMDELVYLSQFLGISFRDLGGRLPRAGGYDLAAESVEQLNAEAESVLLSPRGRPGSSSSPCPPPPTDPAASCARSVASTTTSTTTSSCSVGGGGDGPPLSPFRIERLVWFCLYECCRLSRLTGSLVLLVNE